MLDTFVSFLDKIRLAGYFNEAAGALQASFWPDLGKHWDTTAFWKHKPPTWFKGLCAVTWAYAIGAISGKTLQSYQQAKHSPDAHPVREALKTFGKETLFQGVATVVVPTYAIHAVQKAAQWVAKKISPASAQSKVMPWIRLLAGIGAMPVAANVIDGLTHTVLSHTYDKVFKPYLPHTNSTETGIHIRKGSVNLLSSPPMMKATHLQAAGYHYTLQKANARFELYSLSGRANFGQTLL